MPFPTRISTLPADVTPTIQPGLLSDIKFLDTFSSRKADWQVIPGNVPAAQINEAVAELEGDHMNRVNQKVINGFLIVPVTQVGGQAFEALVPAELVDGKLKELTVKNVRQTPILSSHGVLLEDYFALNYPDVVDQWAAQGAQYEDFKYAAIVTITWATKYGPLRISYKLSGKYISEEGKYPGRVDFLKQCMYEQTIEHYLPNNRQAPNWYPVPIVGLSVEGGKNPGIMQSDAFGWTPMTDFAEDESDLLSWIGHAVNNIPIESKETLERLQAAFDRTYMPVHCAEVTIE